MRAMVGRFPEVCRIRCLKVNAGKSNVIVLGREEGLECEVCVDGIRLDMFRNLNTWDMFWTNQILMRQNLVERWRVGGG